MNETLEQKALRISAEVGTEMTGLPCVLDDHAKEFSIKFARRLLAETGQGEPVAFATNGYGEISLYWREGLVIDFIPNGTTIGLYASPQLPPDHVAVPREPTAEMCAAGFCVSEAEHDPAGVYRAMLAAHEGKS